ncbi:MAG: hypothetical protein HY301_12925 [Verrucomicrobia bacterium]|nr:hypothetical protein [Verrucomicrobiota bacterium]
MAAIALMVGICVPPASAVTIKGEAVVVAMKGTAQYTSNGRDWFNLANNAVLRPGMEIRTSKDTFVDLFLNYNGPAIRIESEAQVVLAKLDREEKGLDIVTDTYLKVKTGSIVGYAQKASPGSRYVVESPKEIVTITGTAYTVNALGFVVVTSGSVTVRYAPNGTTFGIDVVIHAGFSFDPTTGTEVATNPSDSDNLIANVNALSGNIRRFNLARGAKIEVKAVSN